MLISSTYQKPRNSQNSGRAPKKAKTVLSAGKVVATVFWDSQSVIHIDYTEKGKTITELELCPIIGPIRHRIAEKTAPFGKKKVPLPP